MKWLLGFLIACALWSGSAHAACTDSVPAPAAAYGLTNEVFCDGPFSLGTIDLSNTATITNPAGSCASGSCKWYTDSNTPNAAIGVQCPGAAGTCVPTPSSTITISSGVLTLNRLTAYSGSRVDLTTCKYNGVTTAPGYFGFSFRTPAYIKFSATYATGTDSATAEAAIWTVSQNYNVGGIRALQAIELDFLEGAGSPGPRHTNDVFTDGLGGQTEYFQNMLSSNSSGHPINGSLIIPQRMNPNNDGAATGLQVNYDNDVLIPSNALKFGSGVVSSYNGTSPAGTGAPNVNGGFQTLNTDSYCLWMGAGQSIPLVVTYIQVWGLPPTHGTQYRAELGEHGR